MNQARLLINFISLWVFFIIIAYVAGTRIGSASALKDLIQLNNKAWVKGNTLFIIGALVLLLAFIAILGVIPFYMTYH